MSKYVTTHQYEPLSIPSGWKEDEKRLVNRITEIFDDIYRRYGRLGVEDISTAFSDALGLIRTKANNAYSLAEEGKGIAESAQIYGEQAMVDAHNAQLKVGCIVMSATASQSFDYGTWSYLGSGSLAGNTVYLYQRTS